MNTPKKRTSAFRYIALIVMLMVSLIAITTPVLSAQPIRCHDFFAYGNPADKVTHPLSYVGQYLCRQGYVSAYSYGLKEPVVVTYHLTAQSVNKRIKRRDSFKPDTDVPTQFQATLGDYRHSGYDRGHLAPYAAMDFSPLSARQSFLLSNMSPQKPGLNRAGWAQLETYVRRWANQYGSLWVYDGAIYQRKPLTTIGHNKVAVPDAFFKVIYAPNKSVGKNVIAFIMPNAKVSRKNVSHYRVSVYKIEQATGLHFLSALSQPKRQALFSNPTPMWTTQAGQRTSGAVTPPAYLRVAKWQQCLATQHNGTWTAYCLPKERQVNCPIDSWKSLQHLTTPVAHCR